jgi:hypothetical protein
MWTTQFRNETLIPATTTAAPPTQLEIGRKTFLIVDALHAYSAGIDQLAGSTLPILGGIFPDENSKPRRA